MVQLYPRTKTVTKELQMSSIDTNVGLSPWTGVSTPISTPWWAVLMGFSCWYRWGGWWRLGRSRLEPGWSVSMIGQILCLSFSCKANSYTIHHYGASGASVRTEIGSGWLISGQNRFWKLLRAARDALQGSRDSLWPQLGQLGQLLRYTGRKGPGQEWIIPDMGTTCTGYSGTGMSGKNNTRIQILQSTPETGRGE